MLAWVISAPTAQAQSETSSTTLNTDVLLYTPLNLPQSDFSDSTISAQLGGTSHGLASHTEADSLADGLLLRTYDFDDNILSIKYLTFENYEKTKQQDHNHKGLRTHLADSVLGGTGRSGEHIQIDIPFKIRSQTFQRIFGSGRIGMNVTGQIGIRGAFRSEKRESESASQFANNKSNFNLEQNQQFTVVGKIGEKVDVHIDQDTERTFDFENSLSITYTGEPEEIIQKLEVGNISMSLPSTRFVNFSERSSGLFGLKAVTRFGPLEITGVASSEKNESKSQKARGDGSSESSTERNLGDWVPNIFFINSFYRDMYRIYDPNTMVPTTFNEIVITRFTLYRFSPNDDAERKALHLLSPNIGDELPFEGEYLMTPYTWTGESDENLPFEIDPQRGIVRLSFRPSRNEFVAMSYVTGIPTNTHFFDGQQTLSQSGLSHGPFFQGEQDNAISDGDSVVVLVPQNFSPDTQPYWDLMLKNVYPMNAQNAADGDFDMRILKKGSNSTDDVGQGSDNFLSIFYLDNEQNATGTRGKDGKVDLRWLDTEKGELWFPAVEPFGADPNWNQVLDNTSSDPTPLPNIITTGEETRLVPFEDAEEIDPLYSIRTTDLSYLDLISKYSLESTAQVGTEVINLGWNVSNVSVTANGHRLVEGTDYELDEFAGIVRIINSTYTAPNQEIEVTYETPQLFQLRKKTYAGLSAKYDLGKSNFLGASMIYFNEESSERKIRLGNEPIKNLIFDVNGKVGFKPRIMTNMVDALPLIEADAESKLNLEAEFAMVLPDPNPSNNANTGDNNGVAYVDDFESSKQEIPMGLGQNQWFMSSKPASNSLDLGYRGQLDWWNPRDRIDAREIWAQYEQGSTETGQNNLRVFRIYYYPFTLESQLETGSEFSDNGSPIQRNASWAGMYYDFRGAYDDLSDKKYLELTFRTMGDHSGRLNIDLGVISEDVIPNGILDTEDANNNNSLEQTEDVGLDGQIGEDPPWPLPDSLFGYEGSDQMARDFWDTNLNGFKEASEPWSYDNWVRATSYLELNVLPTEIDHSHGWEGNRGDADQLFPDTEDRNGNKSLDQDNDYFSYSIPLNPDHPEFDVYASPLENNWYYVRIPLNEKEADHFGSPNLTLVNGVRLWFSGNTFPVTMDIVEFNVVGNEWRETQVADSDTSNYELTVLNNFDNRQDYYGPPGVEGQKDFLTQQVSREQSLVMRLEGLPFGQTAWARKQFATPQSFTEYRRLRMFMHGGSFTRSQEQGEVPGDIEFVNDEELEFIFRIQSSTGNYYEYSKFIRAGWHENNNIDVIFNEITGLENFTDSRKGHEEPDKPILLSDGGQVKVVGNPSINQVRTLLFGVKNHSARPTVSEVWFNELRVSEVKKENATAVRAKIDANFSDLISMNANYERQDAAFHNVKQRSSGNNQTLSRKRNFTGSTDLGRLLPPDWNTQISVSGSWSHDFKLPKYFPNDDDEVDINNHPEWVEDVSRRRSMNASINKSQSEHLLGKLLIDKLSLRYELSETVSRNKLIAGDTLTTQAFRTSYNSGNFNWKHRLRPLAFVPDWPLIGGLGEMELNYFPGNLTLGANTSRQIRDKLDRDGTFLHTEQYTLDRNIGTSFQPLSSFGFSISRQYQNNLLFDRNQTTVPQISENPDDNEQAFFDAYDLWLTGKPGFFEGDHNISQPISFNYDPQLVGWLSTNFSYSSSYTWRRTLNEPARGVDMSSRGDFTARLRFKTKDVMQALLFLNADEMREIKNTATEAKAERQEKRNQRKAARQEKREQRKAARANKNASEDKAPEQAETSEETTDGSAPSPVPSAPPELQIEQDQIDPLPQFAPLLPEQPDTTAVQSSLIPATGDSLSAGAITLPGDSLLASGTEVTEAEEEKGPGLFSRGVKSLYHNIARFTESFDDLSMNFNRNNSFTSPSQAVFPWTSDWTNRHATIRYQLGLTRDTGLDNVEIGNFGVIQTQRSFGYDYRLNTKFKFFPRVPLDLSYEYDFSQSFTDERETTRRETENGWYSFDNENLFGGGTLNEGDQLGGNPSLLTIPNYSLNMGGLEKLPVFRSLFTTVSLNHSYNGRLETTYSADTQSGGMYRSRLSFTRVFSPLVGLDFSTSKGWSGSMSYTVNRSVTVNQPDAPTSRSMNYSSKNSINMSANRVLKKGFKLPFMKKGLKNQTTIRLEYTRSIDKNINSTPHEIPGENGEESISVQVWNIPRQDTNWRLRGSADFRFSDNVTGGMFYEFGSSRSGAISNRMSYTEFGMNCTIQIRNSRGRSSGRNSRGSQR